MALLLASLLCYNLEMEVAVSHQRKRNSSGKYYGLLTHDWIKPLDLNFASFYKGQIQTTQKFQSDSLNKIRPQSLMHVFNFTHTNSPIAPPVHKMTQVLKFCRIRPLSHCLAQMLSNRHLPRAGEFDAVLFIMLDC